ncbi:MAG: archaellin/type IV pilin N-terminal domain-containing protein [Nitrososphaerales archaeon]
MKKRGISPVIASIILIAITVAVAIAVAGWVFGLFGTYVGGGGVSIVYGPNTYISAGAAPVDFSFTFRNSGSSAVSIVAVDFGALQDATDGTITTIHLNKLTLTGNADTTVTPHTTNWNGWKTNAAPEEGHTYTITFTLSDGTVMPVVLTAIA